MVRLKGAARAGYTRGFAQHIERLAAALRLSPDPRANHERVTHLMSSLVGALLFARAIDNPEQSEAMLHAMRRQLRAQFCCPDKSTATLRRPNDASATAHDFMRTV